MIERKDGAQRTRKAILMELPNLDAFRELHLRDARQTKPPVAAITRVFVTGMKFRRFRFCR
jgi:hypothetical protein